MLGQAALSRSKGMAWLGWSGIRDIRSWRTYPMAEGFSNVVTKDDGILYK